ncbi:FAD binding domain-containing protein [Bacillus sp. 165]|uniref:FAD binding domain-containing protein n=1 Tax=Bacillus sp. 165 TaxID=1529117 RepID=UPI001ADCFFA6|nr:FAD binding domain-containing protein [Bacillus sp. 165]MBO9129431.1 FAD binding domain-containing protein [Bacillus sp. 165]
MIPFDFEYYQPHSIREAVQLFYKLYREKKQPLYYGGGTEIITLGRNKQAFTKAVIDIKEIPECNVLGQHKNHLVLGTALTLTQVAEASVFPLLGKTAAKIADHTARNKITLGGNIVGEVPYREAVLPFLLTNSTLVVAGMEGVRYVPIHQMFIEKLRLNKGEFLVQMITDIEYVTLPYYTVKKRKLEKIDYPLVTMSALKKGNNIRMAFSGLCAFPFRSLYMEAEINNHSLRMEERIERTILQIPASVLDDLRGSKDYRLFVLKNMLLDMVTSFEGGSV